MNKYMLLFFILATNIVAFTQGGIIPLEGFKYSNPSIIYSIGTKIKDNKASFDKGVAIQFEIFPSLPLGFSFNTKTGLISGIPAVQSNTINYTITATNPISSVEIQIEIGVSNLKKFCVPNRLDSVIIFDPSNPEERKNLFIGQSFRRVVFGNNKFAVANLNLNTVTIINALTDEIETTISVGERPFKMAFGNNNFAVINGGSNTVSIIDSISNEKIKDIPVGDLPIDIAFNNNKFAVVNQDSANLSIIDAKLNEVVKTIDLFGGFPFRITSGKNFFVITDSFFNGVHFVDAKNDSFLGFIQTGQLPLDVIFGNNKFAVVNNRENSVSIINSINFEVNNIENVGVEPLSIAFGNSKFAIANFKSNDTTIIDTDTEEITSRIKIGTFNRHVNYGANHFICSSGDIVAVIDATNDTIVNSFFGSSLEQELPVFSLDDNLNRICAVSELGAAVIIDDESNSILDIIGIEGGASFVAFGDNIFAISNPNTNNVTLIDGISNQIIRSVPVGNSPQEITFGEGVFAVVNLNSNSVSIIDAINNNISEIPVEESPNKVVFGNKLFAVINSVSDSISFIEPTTRKVIATVKVGQAPTSMAFNDQNLVVTNFLSGSISIIDTNTFIDTTIPLGISPINVKVKDDELFIADFNANRVIIVDAKNNEVKDEISILRPELLELGSNRIVTISKLLNFANAINLAKRDVLGSFELGLDTFDVIFSNERFFISSTANGVLTIFDPFGKTIMRRIFIPSVKGLAVGKINKNIEKLKTQKKVNEKLILERPPLKKMTTKDKQNLENIMKKFSFYTNK